MVIIFDTEVTELHQASPLLKDGTGCHKVRLREVGKVDRQNQFNDNDVDVYIIIYVIYQNRWRFSILLVYHGLSHLAFHFFRTSCLSMLHGSSLCDRLANLSPEASSSFGPEGLTGLPRHRRMTSVNSTAVVRLTEENARSWWMWILVSNGFESLDESSPKTSKTTNTDDVQPSLNYIRGTEDLCARCHDQNILQYKMQSEGFAAYLADLAQGIWIA